jgi:hypothetical protein
MSEPIPSYVEARIRARPPSGACVVSGSTPVIAFGDYRKATVATLGLNPSLREFIDRDGRELAGGSRRLETLASVGSTDLAGAPIDAIRRVFDACIGYFQRNPYREWFDQLEAVLKPLGASFYAGSACHLDLVQWATDPTWGKLNDSAKRALAQDDLPFLMEQVRQSNFRLMLLNGRSVVEVFQQATNGVPHPTAVQAPNEGNNSRYYEGRLSSGLQVVGWSINLQSFRGNPFIMQREIVRVVAALVGRRNS